MLKKLLSIFLVVSFLLLSFVTAYSTESKAEILSVYGDNMLFKQNEEAVISGKGNPGSNITVELLDGNNNLVYENTVSVESDGVFEVSFIAPSGSYEEYVIILKQNGEEFKRLKNVVFGELWLASGQSNMQYPLSQAKYGAEMAKQSLKLNKYLRVLITPTFHENNGTVGVIPSEPQQDIPGSKWISGEDFDIYGMSAVAYFFANKMIEELDMPVGILNISLGGTTISSWISRKSIESNEKVKNDMISSGTYVNLSEWDKTERNIYTDMSTNYNYRIEAVKNFNLSGMIWYQGESDIFNGSDGSAYSRAFDLLQRSYTELFGFENGLLPVVFTQLASYFYSDEGWELPARNVDFSEIQQQQPDSRALISIYDIPLTYIPAVGVIHPESKSEVGERMAFAALGLVHDNYDAYTTATVSQTEIKDGAIFVTLKKAGDKLAKKGETLKGFSICGNDGIYVKADAEIVDADTVKIYNNDIPFPCSAAYAYSLNNEKSNLYASINGKLTLPVSPFVTDRSIDAEYWSEKTWADCDEEIIWHTVNDSFSGFYSSWIAENTEIKFVSDDKFEGDSSIRIDADKEKFSISPVLGYKDGLIYNKFNDTDSDYSNFGLVHFQVKNTGLNDIKIDNIRFYINDLMWFSPAAENTSDDSLTIVSDNEWHYVSFDLNKLYCYGFETGLSYPNKFISDVKNISIVFESENGSSSVLIDNICFTPETEDTEIGFDVEIDSADNIFEYISCVFVTFIGKIVSLLK